MVWGPARARLPAQLKISTARLLPRFPPSLPQAPAAMAEVTQGITKRLSFGELAQLNNNSVDVEDVIKALRNEGHPTVESFRT